MPGTADGFGGFAKSQERTRRRRRRAESPSAAAGCALSQRKRGTSAAVAAATAKFAAEAFGGAAALDSNQAVEDAIETSPSRNQTTPQTLAGKAAALDARGQGSAHREPGRGCLVHSTLIKPGAAPAVDCPGARPRSHSSACPGQALGRPAHLPHELLGVTCRPSTTSTSRSVSLTPTSHIAVEFHGLLAQSCSCVRMMRSSTS